MVKRVGGGDPHFFLFFSFFSFFAKKLAMQKKRNKIKPKKGTETVYDALFIRKNTQNTKHKRKYQTSPNPVAVSCIVMGNYHNTATTIIRCCD